jgi:hypothetical protein
MRRNAAIFLPTLRLQAERIQARDQKKAAEAISITLRLSL